MKKVILYSLSLVAACEMNFAYADRPVTREVNIAASDVFIPEVLKSTDDVKIVLTGWFPNSCYRWSRAEVIHSDGNSHQVRAMAWVTTNSMCLMVLMTFSKEVNLGRLPAGEHTLRFVSGDETYFERTLVVQ